MYFFSRIKGTVVFAALAAVFVCAQVRTDSRLQEGVEDKRDVPRDTLITLERTSCYGTCPIYKITISADGNVSYEGRRFVKKTGTAKSVISQEQIRELLAAFEEIKFFELRSQYAEREDGCKEWWTDMPSAITSISSNGKSKSVKHYYGCQGLKVLADLQRLEHAIDTAVDSAQWVR
jgi:hypothetical protein